MATSPKPATRTWKPAHRLDLLAELAGIEQEIAAVEINCGLSLDSLVCGSECMPRAGVCCCSNSIALLDSDVTAGGLIH